MTSENMTTKKELWLKVHREKVTCPGCQRVMSRRALRWRHVCRTGPRLIDDAEAEERRQKYEELTLKSFQERAG